LGSSLQQLNKEIADLVEKVSRSLVVVKDGRRGGGAGTIWHSKGLIVTNAHILSREYAEVTLEDGRILEAKLLAIDEKRDLAALAIDIDGEDLPCISLGDSNDTRPGQLVFALGHPWGVNGAVTSGVLMGGGDEQLRVSYPQGFLAVNLSLRPGNSGGPLVDVEGRLLGINSVMTGPDSGLAIPVNAAKRFLKEMVA